MTVTELIRNLQQLPGEYTVALAHPGARSASACGDAQDKLHIDAASRTIHLIAEQVQIPFDRGGTLGVPMDVAPSAAPDVVQVGIRYDEGEWFLDTSKSDEHCLDELLDTFCESQVPEIINATLRLFRSMCDIWNQRELARRRELYASAPADQPQGKGA